MVVIEALGVPEECHVSSPPLDEPLLNRLRERGLLAADLVPRSTAQSNEINILVGSDYYWQVVTGNVYRLSNQVTAVETIFGLVVQGTYAHTVPSTSGTANALFLSCMPCCGGEPAFDASKMCKLDTIGILDC